ncbi:MAG: carboxymuconolactone decarboxylase family protein [Deltaproteobacteria bacterium]|nr:carboxymuconolactone decarboxylase family protein [Deltaproteobacteria bacterium]
MPRIPLVDPTTAPEAVRATFDKLSVPLDIFKMMAHAAESFRPLLRLGSSILARQQLDAKLREYTILLAVHSFGGRYEWVQHVPIAEDCGITPRQIAALESGDLTADCFGEKEKAFLAFVDQSIREIRVGDATFNAMLRHFSHRELVETLLTIGYYQMLARLTECTDLEPQEPSGVRVVQSAAQTGSRES